MRLLKYPAKLIRALISGRAYRCIRFGIILAPNYYKDIIIDIENQIDIQSKSSEDEGALALLLRKNAHIIDKGLQRRDFEKGHSKVYFEQAKYCLSKIKSPQLLEDESVAWSNNKLDEYADRQNFPSDNTEIQKVATGDYDALIDIIRNRRSCRNFSNSTVSNEIIKKIISPVNWAPSSCNKQPLKIFVTNDPNLVIDCLRQCKGATGFSNFVPAFLSFCVDMRGYVLPSEIFLPSIDASLGAQNCALAAHTLGLGTTILSWAQKSTEEEIRLRAILNIANHYMIILNMAVGYPDPIPPPPRRKSLTNTIEIRNQNEKEYSNN